MGEQYINFGELEAGAGTLDKHNAELWDRLHEIQRLIKSLEGEYESDSAVEIRNSIQAMEPKFQAYHDVVDNYAKFLRNTANAGRVVEATNTKNAANVSNTSNIAQFN